MKCSLKRLENSLKSLKGNGSLASLLSFFSAYFFFDLRQTKKPTVSLSEMRQTELNELLDRFQLPIDAVDINDIYVGLTEEDIQPFSWDARNENQQANETVLENSSAIKEGSISLL